MFGIDFDEGGVVVIASESGYMIPIPAAFRLAAKVDSLD